MCRGLAASRWLFWLQAIDGGQDTTDKRRQQYGGVTNKSSINQGGEIAITVPRLPVMPSASAFPCRVYCIHFLSLSTLAVGDVRHGAVITEVHVQAVLVKVLGHHHAGLDDARLLGQVALAKALSRAC
jgi:hypothetical protein